MIRLMVTIKPRLIPRQFITNNTNALAAWGRLLLVGKGSMSAMVNICEKG